MTKGINTADATKVLLRLKPWDGEIMWSEVKLLNCVRLFATPWTVAYRAPPGFSRREYWSGEDCTGGINVIVSTFKSRECFLVLIGKGGDTGRRIREVGYVACFGDGGRSMSQGIRGVPQSLKMQGNNSPQEYPKGVSPPHIWILTQWDWIWTSDLQNLKNNHKYQLYYFKPLGLWSFVVEAVEN